MSRIEKVNNPKAGENIPRATAVDYYRTLIDDTGKSPQQKASEFWVAIQASPLEFQEVFTSIGIGLTSISPGEKAAAQQMTRIIASAMPGYLQGIPSKEEQLTYATNAAVGIVSGLKISGDQTPQALPQLLKRLIARFDQEGQLLVLNDVFAIAEHLGEPLEPTQRVTIRNGTMQGVPQWEIDLGQRVIGIKELLEAKAAKGVLDEKTLRVAAGAIEMPESLFVTGIAQTGAQILHLFREGFKNEGYETAVQILTSAFANATEPTKKTLAAHLADDEWTVYIKGFTPDSVIPRGENFSFVIHDLLRQVDQGNQVAGIALKALLDATTNNRLHAEDSGREIRPAESPLFAAIQHSLQFKPREKALVTQSHFFDNERFVITEALEDSMLVDIMEGKRRVLFIYENGEIIIVVTTPGTTTGLIIGYRRNVEEEREIKEQEKRNLKASQEHTGASASEQNALPTDATAQEVEAVDPAHFHHDWHFFETIDLDPRVETREQKIVAVFEELFGDEPSEEEAEALAASIDSMWKDLYGLGANRTGSFVPQGNSFPFALNSFDTTTKVDTTVVYPRITWRHQNERLADGTPSSDISGIMGFDETLLVPFSFDKSGYLQGIVDNLYMHDKISMQRLLQIDHFLVSQAHQLLIEYGTQPFIKHAARAKNLVNGDREEIAPDGIVYKRELEEARAEGRENVVIRLNYQEDQGPTTITLPEIHERLIETQKPLRIEYYMTEEQRRQAGIRIGKGKVVQNPYPGRLTYLPVVNGKQKRSTYAARGNAERFYARVPEWIEVYSLNDRGMVTKVRLVPTYSSRPSTRNGQPIYKSA